MNHTLPPYEGDAVQFLTEQYLAKKETNAAYSLRMFAKDIGVSPAQISQVLSRQRPISYRQMSRILAALNVDNAIADKIISGIILKAGKTAKISKQVRLQANLDSQSTSPIQMSTFPVQQFKFISQWYHFAILELTYLSTFQSDATWIAKALGIEVIEAKSAIDRLVTLGFLTQLPDGTLKKTHARLSIQANKSEPEIRKYESTMMDKAKEALNDTSPESYERRLINSITFPVSPELVPEIKGAIRKFQRELFNLIQDKTYSEVYHFGCQFFPISKSKQVPGESL